MMKHASSHENAKDFMRRLIQNASNSEIWENFVKYTTETLLNHAEICERIKMKTSDVATRAQLSKVIKFKTNFLKQFGSIAKKDIGPVRKKAQLMFVIVKCLYQTQVVWTAIQ